MGEAEVVVADPVLAPVGAAPAGAPAAAVARQGGGDAGEAHRSIVAGAAAFGTARGDPGQVRAGAAP
jgi:hypothetical protein